MILRVYKYFDSPCIFTDLCITAEQKIMSRVIHQLLSLDTPVQWSSILFTCLFYSVLQLPLFCPPGTKLTSVWAFFMTSFSPRPQIFTSKYLWKQEDMLFVTWCQRMKGGPIEEEPQVIDDTFLSTANCPQDDHSFLSEHSNHLSHYKECPIKIASIVN